MADYSPISMAEETYLESFDGFCESCGAPLVGQPLVLRTQSDGMIVLCDECADQSAHYACGGADGLCEIVGFDDLPRLSQAAREPSANVA